MAVTDQEFNQLRKRVVDLEDINTGQRLKNIRGDVDAQGAAILALKVDVDNAHAAFMDMRALVDDLVLQLGAACERITVLETASNPIQAAA